MHIKKKLSTKSSLRFLDGLSRAAGNDQFLFGFYQQRAFTIVIWKIKILFKKPITFFTSCWKCIWIFFSWIFKERNFDLFLSVFLSILEKSVVRVQGFSKNWKEMLKYFCLFAFVGFWSTLASPDNLAGFLLFDIWWFKN